MTGWTAVLLACATCYALKAAGYLLPQRLLADRRVASVAGLVTVGLLAALVAVQTFAQDTTLVVDARLGALVVAAAALLLRAPFVVVVVLGALAAAAIRVVAGP